MEVAYLGIRISSDDKIEEEMRLQVNKANKAAGRLNYTVLRKYF